MAHYQDIQIDQGQDIAIQVELINRDGTPKDLTGHSVAAMIKKSYNADSADSLTFSSIVSAPATDGIVVLALTNQQTDALQARRNYVYDVEISFVDSDANTIIERVLEGRAYIHPSVTR